MPPPWAVPGNARRRAGHGPEGAMGTLWGPMLGPYVCIYIYIKIYVSIQFFFIIIFTCIFMYIYMKKRPKKGKKDYEENESWQKFKCCSYEYGTCEMNTRVIPAIL